MNGRFKYVKDTITNNIYTTEKGEHLLGLVNNLAEENIILRADGTRLKLVVLQIIEDLERMEGNEEYVDWIKSNCNLELYSNMDLSDLKNINGKRNGKSCMEEVLKKALMEADNSVEYNVILKLCDKLGVSFI